MSTRSGAYFVLSAPSLKQHFVTLVNKLKGGVIFSKPEPNIHILLVRQRLVNAKHFETGLVYLPQSTDAPERLWLHCYPLGQLPPPESS